MARATWMVGTFLATYVIGTSLRFLTYLLLGPRLMWVCVFTLMPFVSGLLIYLYLTRVKIGCEASLRESLIVTAVWILLSFTLDAITYILIVPTVSHVPPSYNFFHDQLPWIWLSYVVLLGSALSAREVYGRRMNA